MQRIFRAAHTPGTFRAGCFALSSVTTAKFSHSAKATMYGSAGVLRLVARPTVGCFYVQPCRGVDYVNVWLKGRSITARSGAVSPKLRLDFTETAGQHTDKLGSVERIDNLTLHGSFANYGAARSWSPHFSVSAPPLSVSRSMRAMLAVFFLTVKAQCLGCGMILVMM